MGAIRVGVGGWTYEPWRGLFYPPGLQQKRELEHMSRRLTAVEINGTFYSTFEPDSWRKWRDETPDDFIFAVKGSRYVTNRKVLADAGPAIEKFVGQGLSELGPKLGPINWQLANTKKFDPEDVDAFLRLLPPRGRRRAAPTCAGGPSPEFRDARVRRAAAPPRRGRRLYRCGGLALDPGRHRRFHLRPPPARRRNRARRLPRTGAGALVRRRPRLVGRPRAGQPSPVHPAGAGAAPRRLRLLHQRPQGPQPPPPPRP
jgi:hypothetical protein